MIGKDLVVRETRYCSADAREERESEQGGKCLVTFDFCVMVVGFIRAADINRRFPVILFWVKPPILLGIHARMRVKGFQGVPTVHSVQLLSSNAGESNLFSWTGGCVLFSWRSSILTRST